MQDAALAERAYWCRKFAKANAVALRKILKKHDKCCNNTAGREFLQVGRKGGLALRGLELCCESDTGDAG